MASEKQDLADPIDIHVGGAIRIARAERGLTQTALAEAVGVSFQQVQKYENGSNRVSASALARIAATLDRKVGDFFPDADDTPGAAPAATEGSIREVVGLDEMTALFSRLSLSRRALLLDVARQFSSLELLDDVVHNHRTGSD